MTKSRGGGVFQVCSRCSLRVMTSKVTLTTKPPKQSHTEAELENNTIPERQEWDSWSTDSIEFSI